MNYVVRSWSEVTGVRFMEFMNLDDAQAFADKEAMDFVSEGWDYDVSIYEMTKY